MAVGSLALLSVIELIIGFKNGNGYLIKDCIMSTLFITSMLASFNAGEASKTARNSQFNYGHLRINILAAFTNMIYILCAVLFKFLDLVHTMIEHKEE
jgi:Co/Zn/Cd efflux system component